MLDFKTFVADVTEVTDQSRIDPRLNAFCTGIKRAMPHVKFGRPKTDENQTITSLYVYTPNEVMVSGVVLVSQNKNQTKWLYGVKSRDVENQNCATFAPNRHVKQSTNIDTAVRNAKALLTPPKNPFIVDCTFGKFKDHHSLTRAGKEEKTKRALGRIKEFCHHTYFDKETFVSAREVVQFAKNPSDISNPFYQKIKDFADLYEDYAEHVKKFFSLTFVSVKQANGMTYCQVTPLVKDRSHKEKLYLSELNLDNPTSIYTEEELPDPIVDKLAVLAMLDDEQHVDDVGYKFNDQAFYLYTYHEE